MCQGWVGGAGKVREAFTDSQRYRGYLAIHLPPALKGKEQEFAKDPAAPAFLLGFLRHVLEERLKMQEEGAKLVILTLSNEARKAGEEEYARLAFGDLNTGEFVWGGKPARLRFRKKRLAGGFADGRV